VGVSAPKVAHSEGQWEVTVVYMIQVGIYAKRVRKTVFTMMQPKIGEFIEVNFL
jgi:hypothetical protein